MWDVSAKPQLIRVFEHTGPVYALGWVQGDELIYAGDDTGVVVWDVKRCVRRKAFTCKNGARTLAVSEDGARFLAAHGYDQAIQMRGCYIISPVALSLF